MVTEKVMQKMFFEYLKTNFKKAKIINEYPFIHGTADLFMEYKEKIYIFELKLKVNEKLFEQSLKHKVIADYIFSVAYLPKTNNCKKNWELKAIKLNLNLLWMEEVSKSKIEKASKNDLVKLGIRKAIYKI